MRTLLLMRHAKSSWDSDGVDDHDRPLNARGARSAPQMAKLLRDAGLAPGLILSSTALRARSTALAVAEAYGWKPEVRLRRGLYLADPPTLLAEISRLPDEAECVLMVGHNPGTEDLVSDLSAMRQAMPTAAVARFAVSASGWAAFAAERRAELVQVYRPRDVD